jgi:hypothetical protein
MAPRAVLTSHEPEDVSFENISESIGNTWLHLGDQLLVEETSSLLVEWAVNGNNITLRQHLLQVCDTSAANLLLNLGL